MPAPLVEAIRINKAFEGVRALHDVSFDLFAGETLGLVGESGSGKSTLARAILRLVRPDRGSVIWRGRDLESCDSASLRRLLRDFLDSHAGLSDRASLRVRCDHRVRRAALASEHSGWRSYPDWLQSWRAALTGSWRAISTSSPRSPAFLAMSPVQWRACT